MDSFDINNLDRELDVSDFDALSYVNEIFPDETSLADLPLNNSKLQSKARKITATIRNSIRSHSYLGESSQEIIANTHQSINFLTCQVSQIQNRAKETQDIIENICHDIKPLDNAKNNLTSTVTYLRRFQMIVTTVNSLEQNITKKDYQSCGENLLALISLFDDFKAYNDIPIVQSLINRFYDLKRQLRTQISTSLNSTIFSGIPGENSLAICYCIDAFSDDFHSSVVELFCDRFLLPGEEALANIDPLDVHLRYNWFINKSSAFSQIYSHAFPKSWRMSYNLALAFCSRTSSALREKFKYLKFPQNSQLTNFPETEKDHELVKHYLQAFEYTVRFEQKMADYFSKVEVFPFDPNEKMPDFDSTPAGIRAKYEWKQRMKAGIGETKKIEATEFIGLIASTFAPHLQFYLMEERNKFQSIIMKVKSNPIGDIDQKTHLMNSCNILVKSMVATIDKCAGFGAAQSLLELFVILKEELSNYISALTDSLPDPSKTSKKQIELTCSILNTSSLLFSISGSLATKIQRSVK